MKQQKQLPLPHFLKFTSNMTPMVGFLLYDKKDDINIAIIKFPRLSCNLPTARGQRMEFIFHNSYPMLNFAVCIQTFNNVIVFCMLK
jgi:hypothetical protein